MPEQKPTVFDKFRELKRDTILRNAKRSTTWLRNKIQGKGVSKKYITTRPVIGKMYLFQYDAKYKQVLPYWDRHPLSIVIDFYDNGFLGLNMHYLPPRLRLRILELLDKAYRKGTNQRARFAITYGMLKSISKLKVLQPTIHRYLWTHVKTKFVLVPQQEWEYVVPLPLAAFQGATKLQVYAESMRKIRSF